VVTPTDIAVTTPDEEPMVATLVLLLLHVPPAGELVKVKVPNTHTEQVEEPATQIIGVGVEITFNVTDFVQPLGAVYVITEVPGVMPVTNPVNATTVATLRLELVQLPPAGVPTSGVVALTQTVVVPVMVGNALTVTVTAKEQPVGAV
jgi:hypothetical protein